MLAIDQSYQTVVCGHIHQPQIKILSYEKDSILYLNSGDWVENCSALEYNEGQWALHFESFDKNSSDVHNDYDEEWEWEAEHEVFDFLLKTKQTYLILKKRNLVMKILYAVQATGNGHISRAHQLYPYLREMGETDIF